MKRINPLIAHITIVLEFRSRMHHLILTLTLKDGEVLQAKANNDLILRKNVEYRYECFRLSCELSR